METSRKSIETVLNGGFNHFNNEITGLIGYDRADAYCIAYHLAEHIESMVLSVTDYRTQYKVCEGVRNVKCHLAKDRVNGFDSYTLIVENVLDGEPFHQWYHLDIFGLLN